jgi:putative aldouronate transport system substrate-binding protein
MKKSLLIAITLSLTLLLAGCGKDKSSTLSIFLYQEQVVYDEDMAVFKNVNEKIGIELEGFLQPYDSNYRSRFTTGGYRSNLVIYDQDTIESYGYNGTYVDLKPLIEEHAPNIKAFFEANPEKEAWATAADGKIYGIPFYTAGATAKGYFVRKDWVDTLRDAGKINDLPTDLNELTVEDFEDLLYAFKANKSLLTNAKEIYPYFDREEDFWVSQLASLWNGTAEFYVNDQNEVKFGAIEPEFKYAIEKMARWMKDGIIDPSILDGSRSDDRQTHFARNDGGATRDWIGTTYAFNDDVFSDVMVEGFEVVAIAPPQRADGTRFEPTTRKEIGNVAAIYAETSKDDQVKLIQWMDYFFSEEGMDLQNFGILDETYTVSNGEYSFTNKILNDNATALANLYKYGAQLGTPGVQNFAYEEAWLSEDAAEAMKMYRDEAYLDLNYTKLIYPNIKLSKEEYAQVNAARTQIDNELKQHIFQWVVNGTAANGISESDWNTFVKLMKQSGSETVVTIYQDHVGE